MSTTKPPLAGSTPTEDAGKLVLRVVLGVLILLHGIAKLVGGPGFIMGLLAKYGLPPALGYGVYVGEVVAPLLLILGLYSRAAALIVVINMLVAIGLVHMGQIGQLNKTGGWELELQGMYLFGALAVALLGAGRYSVGGLHGRWN
ncbi:DoxX family protein [uncultured Azohydromonas sp.]|jgi:Predicted membrane protein|uniref:DoxX family protein n=1 Tax=uncultured Azohydromonas sp. TaxID=487342 RepID=UPI00262E8FE5|nr:DoxX family protein [uncultured Azohydromonas sp.]